MTNKLDTSDLRKILHELGDAVWGSGKLFPMWVVPRVNTLLQAIDELERLKTELAEKSWRVIGPNFDNLPKLGQRVILFSDGIVRRWAYTADQYDESDRAGVYFWDCDDDQEYCPPIKPGDAWMPWPTEGPKLLEVNND